MTDLLDLLADLTGTVTVTLTYTYRAAGIVDDVDTCEHCGQQDLTRAVRMISIDQDGGNAGETFMGTTCAAKLTGRKATEILTEARRADRAALDAKRATYRAWQDARGDAFMARRTAAIGADVTPGMVRTWLDDPNGTERADQAAWDAANPAPEDPWAR
jgi:hypothetical protein